MKVTFSKNQAFPNCWWGHTDNGAPFGIYKVDEGFKVYSPFKLLPPPQAKKFKNLNKGEELPKVFISESNKEIEKWCNQVATEYSELLQQFPADLLHEKSPN